MIRTLQQLEPYLQGYWPLKTDFKDHSQNSNDGTPTDIIYRPTNRGLKPSFNGNTSKIVIGNIYNGIKTVSFYVKLTSTTEDLVDLNATATVDINAGTVRGNNFTSPTIYVDGQATASLSDLTGFHYIVITTATGINASAVNIGEIAASFGKIFIEDIRFYSVVLTADEILNFYNETKYAHGMIPAERSYTHQLGIKPEDGLVLGFDGHTKNADITFTDMSGESNHGTNVGTSRDVGYFGDLRNNDGTNDYISFGNIGNVKSIEMLIEPDTTTEYLLDLNVTATIDINSGTIQANNFTTPTIYRDAVVQSSISADVLSHIIITTGTNVNATAVYLGKIAANYLDGKVKQVKLYSSELSLINVKSKFNSIATLPLFHVDFEDYPDNEDVSYTDNEPILYSTIQVGSNGTFKIDGDQLVCSENISTLTLRNNHEFDGSEYITIDIDGTKYSGTGTITQGTVTVSISQGSRFITVAMSDTDVLNSIDIQFRAEVS